MIENSALTYALGGVPESSLYGGVPDPTVDGAVRSGGHGSYAIVAPLNEVGGACSGKTVSGRDCRNPAAEGERWCEPHIRLMVKKYAPPIPETSDEKSDEK